VNTALCIKQSVISLAIWVGLGTGLDGGREEKISPLHRGSELAAPELSSP
jgi:hypothetical protein